MYCTHCGAENPDGARYCRACGQVLSIYRRRSWPLSPDEEQETVRAGPAAPAAVRHATPPIKEFKEVPPTGIQEKPVPLQPPVKHKPEKPALSRVVVPSETIPVPEKAPEKPKPPVPPTALPDMDVLPYVQTASVKQEKVSKYPTADAVRETRSAHTELRVRIKPLLHVFFTWMRLLFARFEGARQEQAAMHAEKRENRLALQKEKAERADKQKLEREQKQLAAKRSRETQKAAAKSKNIEKKAERASISTDAVDMPKPEKEESKAGHSWKGPLPVARMPHLIQRRSKTVQADAAVSAAAQSFQSDLTGAQLLDLLFVPSADDDPASWGEQPENLEKKRSSDIDAKKVGQIALVIGVGAVIIILVAEFMF